MQIETWMNKKDSILTESGWSGIQILALTFNNVTSMD